MTDINRISTHFAIFLPEFSDIIVLLPRKSTRSDLMHQLTDTSVYMQEDSNAHHHTLAPL